MAKKTERHEEPLTHAMVAVWSTVQEAAAAASRLLDSGFFVAELGLLVSDRTAERHFASPGTWAELGAPDPFGRDLSRLAADLRPVAALGTPGTGLVASGALVPILTGAGVGTRSDFSEALQGLGVPERDAHEIAERIKNGAVLLGVVPADQARISEAASALGGPRWRSFELELRGKVPRTDSVVEPPEAPAGEQRARYVPPLNPGRDLTAHRSVSSKFKA